MAKFTDAIRATLTGYFNIGDQPTEAQFTALILAIQEGIEEHTHSTGGDGDGSPTIGPTAFTGVGVDVTDGWYIGIGAALERIVFDAAGDIDIIGANVGIETFTPNYTGFPANYTILTLMGRAADTGSILELGVPDLTGANTAGQLRFINLDGGGAVVSSAAIMGAREGTDDAMRMEFWVEAAAGVLTNRMILSSVGELTISNLAGANQPVGADAAGKLYVPHVSDKKFKDNIEPLTGGLDAIRKMRAVTFDWNPKALAEVGLDFGECGQQVGLIAQEVQAAAPLAGVSGRKWKSYSDQAVLGYLLEAVKTNDARLTDGGL